MKETFYFPHDNNAHSDPKLMGVFMELWLTWIWMYWILIEILHQQKDWYITKEQFNHYVKWYSMKENKWQVIVEQLLNTYFTNDLFCSTEDWRVYSSRVLKNKEFREDLSKKRSEAWKKSAEKRAKQKDNPTSVEQKWTSVEQGKERKGKEKEIKYWDLVKLTEEEYLRLVKEYSKQIIDNKIEIMDNRCWANWKKYKDYNKALRTWLKKDQATTSNITKTQTKPLTWKM